MAFDFDNAQGFETVRPNQLFTKNIPYSYFKADDRRPIRFRILPAFPEHDGELTDEQKSGAYVPAVSLIGGRPVVSDWISALLVSRSYVKGSFPIVSRKMIREFDSDGTPVQQEDPLTDVVNYCKAYKPWEYIVKDTGKWGDKDRVSCKLPPPRREYMMNVLTLDDEKPGVKVAIVSSTMAIGDLLSSREGKEGIARQQTTQELTQEQIDANPSCVFLYGDITDPNMAPVFCYMKGETEDGGRKVYRIFVSSDTDTNTGRRRTERMGLTRDMMSKRQDLAHPETFVNIPTVEEQISQLVERCCGRNADGYHEYDMLRAALPDYASLIPAAPSAPGAVGVVQGFTAQPVQKPVQTEQQPVQPVHQPVQQAQKAQPQQQAFTPSKPKAALFSGPAAQKAQPQQQAFTPSKPAAQPTQPTQPTQQAQNAQNVQNVQNVPGEAVFDPSAWEARAKGGEGGGKGDWVTEYQREAEEGLPPF